MRGEPAALRVFLLFCRQFLKIGREKEEKEMTKRFYKILSMGLVLILSV